MDGFKSSCFTAKQFIVLVFLAICSCQSVFPEVTYDAIIVGAGVAGLSAASELKAAGKQVLILEARNRIGGRVWTDRSYEGINVDFGAMWIQGLDDNPLQQIADENDIPYDTEGQDESILFGLDGQPVSDEYSAALDAAGDSFLNDFLPTMLEEDGAELLPLSYAVDEYIEYINQTIGGVTSEYEAGFRWWISSTIEEEAAASASKLSMSFDDGLDKGDENAFLGRAGYDQIVATIAEGLYEHVYTESPVSVIDYTQDTIAVTTRNGTVYNATTVLITVPVGVLRDGSITFEPTLPADKAEAIQRLDMGVLNKVIILFKEQFWGDEFWIQRVTTPAGLWGSFVNFHKYSDRPILCALIAGDLALSAEQDPKNASLAAALDSLYEIYGDEVSEVEHAWVVYWDQEEYSRGSYSYIPVGSSSEDRVKVGSAVEGRLFFAGEAVNNDYPATVHGAYYSGISQAEAMIEALVYG